MYTGLVGLSLAFIVAVFTTDAGSRADKVSFVICCVLLLPLAAAILSYVAFALCYVFWFIWHPYF